MKHTYTVHHKNVLNKNNKNEHIENGSRIRKYKIELRLWNDKDFGYFIGDAVQNMDMKPKGLPFVMSVDEKIKNSDDKEFVKEFTQAMAQGFRTMRQLKAAVENYQNNLIPIFRVKNGAESQSKPKQYESPYEYGITVTPSELSKAGQEAQVDYIVHWFHNFYCDPAMETSYNSREGGYLYTHGGPYSAGDEISDEFGDIVSWETIEKAVAEVESDGLLEWAPTSDHPNYIGEEEDYEPPKTDPLEKIQTQLDSGVAPQFGSDEETEKRTELLREIKGLREDLKQKSSIHGGMGHNQPPPDEEKHQLAEVKEAIDIIEGEIDDSNDNTDTQKIVQSANRLKKALKWAGFAFFGGALGQAGANVMNEIDPTIWQKIADVFDALLKWFGVL